MASTTGNGRKDEPKLYMHKDAAECSAFLARVKAYVRDNDPNAGKLAKLASTGDADSITAAKCGMTPEAFELAQGKLYDAIIKLTGNDDLVRTLQSTYDDKGGHALVYIRGCFASGGNPNKLKIAKTSYIARQLRV